MTATQQAEPGAGNRVHQGLGTQHNGIRSKVLLESPVISHRRQAGDEATIVGLKSMQDMRYLLHRPQV